MGAVASQITSLTIVYSTVHSDADQRKHQSSTSLAFVQGILRGPVNSLHKWPVTRRMFPFDDVIVRNHFEYPSSCVKPPPDDNSPLSSWFKAMCTDSQGSILSFRTFLHICFVSFGTAGNATRNLMKNMYLKSRIITRLCKIYSTILKNIIW